MENFRNLESKSNRVSFIKSPPNQNSKISEIARSFEILSLHPNFVDGIVRSISYDAGVTDCNQNTLNIKTSEENTNDMDQHSIESPIDSENKPVNSVAGENMSDWEIVVVNADGDVVKNSIYLQDQNECDDTIDNSDNENYDNSDTEEDEELNLSCNEVLPSSTKKVGFINFLIL